MKEYIPETFWDERVKVLGDLGDGYANRDYQNYEDKIRMKKAFEVLGDVSGLGILDVGCGTGRWSVRLAKRGAIVTGIDISKEMIKLAKERAGKAYIHNSISFLNKKIEDLNYSNYFDVALSVTVLQHITDEEHLNLAVQNMVNVVKEGGKILVIESAPFEKRVYEGRDMGVKHMELRTKGEWINLFESKGVRFIKSREVCFIGRYFITFCAKRFKNKTTKKVAEKLSEFVDTNFAEWRLFNKYSKPTIFLFEKKR